VSQGGTGLEDAAERTFLARLAGTYGSISDPVEIEVQLIEGPRSEGLGFALPFKLGVNLGDVDRLRGRWKPRDGLPAPWLQRLPWRPVMAEWAAGCGGAAGGRRAEGSVAVRLQGSGIPFPLGLQPLGCRADSKGQRVNPSSRPGPAAKPGQCRKAGECKGKPLAMA